MERKCLHAIRRAATPAAFLHYRLSMFLCTCLRRRPVHISTFKQHILHFQNQKITIKCVIYFATCPQRCQCHCRFHITPTWQKWMSAEKEAQPPLPLEICHQRFWPTLIFLLSEISCQRRESQVCTVSTTPPHSTHYSYDEIKKCYLWREDKLSWTKYYLQICLVVCFTQVSYGYSAK